MNTKLETNTLNPIGEATYAVCDQIVLTPSGGQARKLRNAGLRTHTHPLRRNEHHASQDPHRKPGELQRQSGPYSESEAGMLSLSKSFGKKICKLFSRLDIKHLDPLLFNALTDEEVMHCNVLGILVASRVLSKAERAFVVTKESRRPDPDIEATSPAELPPLSR